MSQIPNQNLLISSLTIPGTHDSGAKDVTFGFGSFAQTQGLDITEQLNAGVRFLDIRCKEEPDGTFQIYHGAISCSLSFQSVLDICTQFLDANPTECILMSIKNEGDYSTSFESTARSYIAQNPAYWYHLDILPTLASARKKIVLLRRFPASSIPLGLDVSDAAGWKDNISNANITITNKASFQIQDCYKDQYLARKEKWEEIAATLELAKSDSSDTLYLNFTSAIGGGPNYLTGLSLWGPIYMVINAIKSIPEPSSLVSYIHGMLSKQLIDNPGKYGVVIVDFVDNNLATAIYNTNF
jgi:1-phosphatidylinositol phosphodiesterase